MADQEPANDELIHCPWCREGGFDLVGLAGHCRSGECEPFDRAADEMADWAGRMLQALDLDDPPPDRVVTVPLAAILPDNPIADIPA